jgi:hypothetical protein
VITIERDGKTIVLQNPTADQLAQVGVSSGSEVKLDGWQLVAMTGAVMWGIVALVWLVLSYRRRSQSLASTTGTPEMNSRMARIENAIESVAVEVERISEGQRFTSRMLSEGAAMPVSVADREAAILQNRGDA